MIRRGSLATILGTLTIVACSSAQPGQSQADAPASSHPDAAASGDGAAAADARPSPAGVVAIPLISLDQAAYTGRVQIGNQSFDAIIDTGSTTLGIAGSTCSDCGVSPEWTPDSTAVDTHNTTSTQYGTGSWSGEVYSDHVQLGSADDVSVDFASITSAGSGFFVSLTGSGAPPYQGILGLGPTAALAAHTTSYSAAAFTAGRTGELAFHNCPDEGTMWVGGVDTAAMASSPVTTPMVDVLGMQLYWAVDVGAVSVGGGASIGGSADFGPTVIDTGTTISMIPTAQLAALTQAIEASSGYKQVFGSQLLDGSADNGCVATAMTGEQIDAALPPLAVSFPDAGGANAPAITVPATKAYLLFEGPSGSGNTNLWCYAMTDSKQITFGLFAMSLFGESLLNSMVAVFDIANNQMQFALQSGCHEADAVAAPRHPRFVAGIPWWKQDPRIRLPDPAAVQRRLEHR